MKVKSVLFASSALAVLAFLPACEWMPGKPTEADRWQNPHKVVDFETLYMENCRGCHGSGKEIAGAISLDNPAYLAILPKEVLQNAISNGIPNTSMPAFALKNGGMLTDQQVDILVNGIMAWAKTGAEAPAGPLPPYAAAPGNAEAGQTLYAEYVAAAEKAVGSNAMFRDGFLTNPTFLGLSSDQYLRTLIIAGRPELGIPDWRTVIPGRALSDGEISDLVAWLISQRKNEFGQPLAPGQQTEAP
jgi:cytochrome c oxidase cbb3-type subunit III